VERKHNILLLLYVPGVLAVVLSPVAGELGWLVDGVADVFSVFSVTAPPDVTKIL